MAGPVVGVPVGHGDEVSLVYRVGYDLNDVLPQLLALGFGPVAVALEDRDHELCCAVDYESFFQLHRVVKTRQLTFQGVSWR